MEREVYPWLLVVWTCVAACVFVALQFLTVPYGRHARQGWGPTIHRTAGWVIMESPAVLVFLACFLVSGRQGDPAFIVFMLLWLLHYLHRAFIYPFRLRGGQLLMPVSVIGMAFLFNVMNGYLQGRGIFTFGPARGIAWFSDPRFIVGVLLFLGGYAINRHSDLILRRLRAPGESGYRIPIGGGFALVSCPNYAGELVEWLGWAILTWSPAGLAFFLWTAANLVPRARSHHRWYLERFPDYPRERKAVIPYIY